MFTVFYFILKTDSNFKKKFFSIQEVAWIPIIILTMHRQTTICAQKHYHLSYRQTLFGSWIHSYQKVIINWLSHYLTRYFVITSSSETLLWLLLFTSVSVRSRVSRAVENSKFLQDPNIFFIKLVGWWIWVQRSDIIWTI